MSHLTAHMGCANARADVTTLVSALAQEYHLIYEKTGIEKYGNVWNKSTSFEAREQAFIEYIQKMEDGKLYYFVEHPGYDTEEMKSISHPTYTRVGEDREWVTKVFTSKKVKEAIEKRGVILLSVKEAFGSK